MILSSGDCIATVCTARELPSCLASVGGRDGAHSLFLDDHCSLGWRLADVVLLVMVVNRCRPLPPSISIIADPFPFVFASSSLSSFVLSA